MKPDDSVAPCSRFRNLRIASSFVFFSSSPRVRTTVTQGCSACSSPVLQQHSPTTAHRSERSCSRTSCRRRRMRGGV
jgi:hypothetical protein